MKVRKLSIHVAVITVAFLLHGCGGSSKSDDPEITPSTLTGVFLDSPVANIDYATYADGVETRSGVTDADGKYDYEAGETVIFSIGDLAFPPVAAAETVTPLDIANTTDPNDTEAVNMIRLLQTLDKDGDPSNGIEITLDAKAAASAIESFDIPDEAFSAAVQGLIEGGGQDVKPTELVSAAEAVAHFEETLGESGVTFDTLTGSWQLEGDDGAVIFHFLPDGRYLAMQWEEDNDFEGFEYGTYTATDGAITFITRENHDGQAITCNQDRGVLCDGTDGIDPGVWAYAFSDEGALVFTIEETDYSFGKIEATDSPVDGLWESRDAKELVFFTMGSAAGAGYFYYVDYESEGDDYNTNFDLGTYTTVVNDGKPEIKIISEQQYNNIGLDCDSPMEGDYCDIYEPGYEVINNQLAISSEAEDEESARRGYFDRVFADDNAPANTAKLVAQKHYASDIAAHEDYGVEIEDDYRTYIQTTEVDTESSSSFKATFTIDDEETLLQRGTDSSAGLETRIYAYYQFPNNGDLTFEVSLRLRYYSGDLTARYVMASCLDTCDNEVYLPTTVTLTGDYTGDHSMEIAWNDVTNSFDFSIDGEVIGSKLISDFTDDENVIAAGGYAFDPEYFRSVRFRVDAFNVETSGDSAYSTTYLDEFSIDGVVYDDFTGGLIDSDKWYYRSEER